ncbi:alpha/beta hydrolase [Mariniphaga sediminis]|uniref:alpha/beta hydrolase n=1 Tax=Mariniphaga sediminis TaxID=1628158 RepID=UPI0035682DA0
MKVFKKLTMLKSLLITLSGILLFLPSFAQDKIQVLYKKIDTTALYMDVFFPVKFESDSVYPAIVFFFGGGWNRGERNQFEPHARYFSSRGMISFLVDYRVRNKHKTTPFESLKDAKSAIRYIRKHASELHVDNDKIVASGGSAGGHLAAATALIKNYNEINEDSLTSCIPNALVLFNPVIDNGPGGYGYERIGGRYKNFSPLHNISKGAPPTIMFLGTEDKLIPVETAKYYKIVMERVEGRCDLKLYEGEAHGFFKFKQEYYLKTVFETDKFLESIGYLKGEPTIYKVYN